MTVFDPEHFTNPTNEYRPLQLIHGMDTWLAERDQSGCGSGDTDADFQDEQDLRRRLEELRRLGIGGIVANVSFNDYLLNERQWEIFLRGMQIADELGLVLWLYDEKGYPSGTAGGLVARANPEYVALSLACYPQHVQGPCTFRFHRPISCKSFVYACAFPAGAESTQQNVVDLITNVDQEGSLTWNAPAGKWTVLYLAQRISYEGTHACSNVYEFRHYVNVLDRAAIAEFIRVTHEQYRLRMPEPLWKKVRAIFTDEPSFMTAYAGPLPERFLGKIPVVDKPIFTDRPAAVPWHPDLLARFRQAKGYNLLPSLYALFGGRNDQAAVTRQDYYEVASAMYAEAFSEQIRNWCARNGTTFSGHFMAEEDLPGHVAYQGSLFAVVRPMQLPGIDMLNSDPQDMLKGSSFMTAKHVSSVAHLTGAKQVHSECSDWVQRNTGQGASLAQRRGQGNLLYALGINQVTAYWSWEDIGEEGYRAYNDYMGRLGSLLRGGRHVCDVAVLYPIRSAWANYTPTSRPPTAGLANEALAQSFRRISKDYEDLVRHLIRSQIDLDIIDEEALATADIRDGALRIADEAYGVVILPTLLSLGVPAAQALVRLDRAGGTIIATGDLPTLADSIAHTGALRQLMEQLFGQDSRSRKIPSGEVVGNMRRVHHCDLQLAKANESIVYTHRLLKGRDLYFLANCGPEPVTIDPIFRLAGPYELYRPLTGQIASTGNCGRVNLDAYEGVFVVRS